MPAEMRPFPMSVQVLINHLRDARGYLIEDDVRHLVSWIEGEPARYATAHQEGYREGLEAAVRAVWKHEGCVVVGSALDAFMQAATVRIRTIPPPPAEPAGGTAEPADWTVSDTELARDILCYLGIGSDASLEPGDRRRDRIAAMICADRERRIVKPATRITAPEAENAALRKVFDAACAMDGFGMFDDLESPSGVRMREATRRARALLQGGSDAG